MTTRTLIVMRHAKAQQHGETDRARPLADRGRDDAAAAGRHLRDHDLLPAFAHVSAARRAQETWRAVSDAAGADAVEEVNDSLYLASPASVLESLRLTPEDAVVAAYVGHNPTAEELVHLLDDREGDPEVVSALAAGFPTAALAVFHLPGQWSELDAASARLVGVHVARAETS